MMVTQQKPIAWDWDTFMQGIWKENPVFVMTLGMCPTLAVTNSATNALAMSLSTTFVLVGSCAMVSMLRHFIPKQVRIAAYILIIAAFVTVIDYVIQALSYEIYKALGAYLQLIVVNCIILGRAEAHAAKHNVTKSVINAMGMGVGFTIGLLCLGSVRELLGAGTLFGLPVFGSTFEPWVIMVLPPGGFLVLASWLLLFSWLRSEKARRLERESMKGVVTHGI
ncbi:MAG: electron transport complex subunit RsxE [Beggiatoa sp. IS2]|nr:MAG: electron transport complex subunit RsxE [Beggiatoa sp. IS2]